MKDNNLKNICNNETFMNLLKLLFHLVASLKTIIPPLLLLLQHKSNNSPKKHTKYLINNSFRIPEYYYISSFFETLEFILLAKQRKLYLMYHRSYIYSLNISRILYKCIHIYYIQ